MSQTIAVIDYGMGNLHSVTSALEHVAPNDRVLVTGDREQILAADKVLFPGVGAMRDCMQEIRRAGVDKVLAQVRQDRPVLAICVGMQALLDMSEENNGVPCLGQVPGEVKFFGRALFDEQGQHLKVPHMGWNCVEPTIDHPMWQQIAAGSRFYFVHSYYVAPKDPNCIAATCHYGHDFAAALYHDSLFAVQFHPEKSHDNGLQLLRNFVRWDGKA